MHDHKHCVDPSGEGIRHGFLRTMRIGTPILKSENRRTTMFYQCKMGQNTLEDVVDKFNIRELIEF